jgi:DNA polymerase-3 subunit alpha
LIDKHRSRFIKEATKRGYSREVCEAIWGDIEYFARYGFNKCLPGDVQVVDAASGRLIRIEDLYHKRAHMAQTVACDTDKLRLEKGSVTNVLANGVKPVYRLTTSLGRQVEATGNHPFYTFDGWRWLAELEPGDQIAVPRTLPVEGNCEWPAYQVITLGHLLAEGNLCHPHSVYYYTQNETSLQDYIDAVEQFDNVECVVSLHRNTCSVYAKRREREREPGVVPWAKLLGIWGKSAVEKEIPAEAFTLVNEQIALLLGRLWDGDGSIRRQVRNAVHAYYATASEKLARQVQHLLLRLGIVSSLRQQFFGYKEGKMGYQVHVMGGEHIRRFAETVGPHMLRTDQLELCEWLLARESKNTSAKDIIPLGVKTLVRAEKEQANLTWEQFRLETGVAQREFYPTATATKKGFRRETIARVAAYFDSSDLYDYANSDIYWDEIVSIEYVGEKQTYDLTVADTHNFVANDILVHNSHAADYAVITCQTAFLKAHYPVEYMAALLSVERDNTDKVAKYLADARRLGIEVAPPDINSAELDFSIEEEDEGRPLIRYGMGAIKNAGTGAIQLILDEREQNGPFSGLEDLCNRVDLRQVGKRALESMIKVGVFDEWGTRPQFLDALDRITGYSGHTHEAAAAGQMSLFGGSTGVDLDVSVELLRPQSSVPQIEHRQLLDWEKELIGVYLSEHPLQKTLAHVPNIVNATTADLDAAWHTKAVTMAGIISTLRPHTTRKGDPMAFASLEDLEGKVDLIFFPRTWKQCRDQVNVDQILVVRGKVKAESDTPTIIVNSVDTNLTIARDADAAPGAASAPPDFDLSPAAPVDRGSERTRQTADPSPAPPPNFDDNWPATTEPAATATVAASPSEPDPVNAAPASEPVPAQPANGSTSSARNSQRGNGRGHEERKTIVVEIKPVGNWKETCRRSLQVAGQFEGPDSLSLRLPGQGLAMDFPNQHTQICPGLVQELRRLPGVSRVYAG